MRLLWFCSLNVLPYSDKVKFINNKIPVVLAPWIDSYINAFRNETESELHIIAEFTNLKEDVYIQDNNVFIYLLSQKMPLLNRGWPHVFRYFTNYYLLNRKVNKIVKKINPDLIHLHGTEHDLSRVALNYLRIPLMATIQGFVNEAVHRNNNFYMNNKLKIENLVFKKCQNFGIRAQFMEEIIKNHNASPSFYYHDYIFERPKITKFADNDAHVVFAARICRDKGIEDLIQALGIVKRSIPDLKFKIIGSIDANYKNFIIELIKANNLVENTNLIGYLHDINDVHLQVAKSMINVLPTHYDIISGTILESMYIGVPVIAYNVGAIPELNEKRDSLIIVNKGDIDGLANTIQCLLFDGELRIKLSYNALITVSERFGDKDNLKKLKSIYIDILKNSINS